MQIIWRRASPLKTQKARNEKHQHQQQQLLYHVCMHSAEHAYAVCKVLQWLETLLHVCPLHNSRTIANLTTWAPLGHWL